MEFNKEQIEELKKKFPKLHQIDVENEEDGKTSSIIVREPTRQDIARMKRLGNGDSIKENEILLNTICLVGDKDSILANDALFFGVVEKINDLVKTAQATIKKL